MLNELPVPDFAVVAEFGIDSPVSPPYTGIIAVNIGRIVGIANAIAVVIAGLNR